MASRDITDELITVIAQDLCDRYALDADDVRAVGAQLAKASRSDDNLAFVDRVLAEHPNTIKRLGS